jgi:hypothetical protein
MVIPEDAEDGLIMQREWWAGVIYGDYGPPNNQP